MQAAYKNRLEINKELNMTTRPDQHIGAFYTPPSVAQRVAEAVSGAEFPAEQSPVPDKFILANPPFGRGNEEAKPSQDG